MSKKPGQRQPDLVNLEVPTVVRRKQRKRRVRRATAGNAAGAIGPIEPGCEIFGFTKGQFTMTDMIWHLITATGPADMAISTWTIAQHEIEEHARMLSTGRLRSLRIILDRGFPSRDPAHSDMVVRTFGPDAIRVTKTHAKFVLLRNEKWNLAVRTSMNLNMNPRCEDFEISDDPVLADFLGEIVDEIFARDDCGVRIGATSDRGGGRVDIPAADSAFRALWRETTPQTTAGLPASVLDLAERQRKDRQLAAGLLL